MGPIGTPLAGFYSYRLVVTSILIAILSSYVANDLSGTSDGCALAKSPLRLVGRRGYLHGVRDLVLDALCRDDGLPTTRSCPATICRRF